MGRLPLVHCLAIVVALSIVACSGGDDAPADSADVASDTGGASSATDEVATPADPGQEADAGPTVHPADVPGAAPVTDAEAESDTPGDMGEPADTGPWVRSQAGDPLSAEEITAFTKVITGFWRDSDYFRWVRMTSHGLDASHDPAQFAYALWWQDTRTSKSGDTVTFDHHGRADNLTLRTCKVLTNALAGYLMFGDEHMKWIAIQYSRGLAALGMATDFAPDDPVRYLQARAIFTHDHSFETIDGRKVAVTYENVRRFDDAWNARIVHNPTNPHWGDMWFVNQRSKDDVPHMYRVVPMLTRAAAEAPDEEVRVAAELALEYLRGFASDVVESEYQIRTRYEDGEAVVPKHDNGNVKDLASFTLYEFADPNSECTAKLGSALVAHDETRDNDCGDGDGGIYETIAAEGHYFNYAIIRLFHVAALSNARIRGFDEAADQLLEGLATRADRILHDETMPHYDRDIWWSDAAAFLLAAGSAGLPLTHEEARLIVEQYTLTAEHFGAFEHWDPWAETTAEGDFDYKPARGLAVRPTEIAYLLEYCASELRHPDSAPLVDCDVIRDPTRWGQ